MQTIKKKRKTLVKLRNLNAAPELEAGFPDQRSCLDWAAKVEPLLDFDPIYKANFAFKLQLLSRNVSSFTAEPAFNEMLTILQQAIHKLEHEIESEDDSPITKLADTKNDYVSEHRIDMLRTVSSENFDFSKLVRLCEELNSNHKQGNHYSVIAICRTIINHVPPIFGLENFNMVANNYRAGKSFKKSMNRLNTSCKDIADQHLHSQIRESDSVPTATQVDFSNDLDLLLAEIDSIMKVDS